MANLECIDDCKDPQSQLLQYVITAGRPIYIPASLSLGLSEVERGAVLVYLKDNQRTR